LKLNPANQEAEKALAALRPAAEAEADQAVSEQPVVAVQPGASSPGGKDASDPKGSSFRPVIVTAGAVGLLLLCISMFCVYAIFTSVAGQGGKSFPAMMLPFAASPTATDTPTLTVTPSPRPSITPSRTPRPTFTLIPTSSPIATFAPVGSILDNSVDITHWNQVVTQDPKNADAYYQRANAYNSIRKVGSLDTVNATLDLALQDIDKAIALRPDQGNYYALRQSIYYNKGSSAQFEVDSEYLYHFALENAIKANQLGTTVQDPDRIIVIDLIAVNQCQAALDMLQQIMAKTPKDQSTYGGLLHIQSSAYACLGRLDDALNSVNASMFNNTNMEYKYELKAEYLIQLGRYDEALPVLNQSFTCCKYLGGYRNYWRAEIYYKTGKVDLVKDELMRGMANTWGRGGMLAYVGAQMSLDAGRKADGIQLLQLAEATFDPSFNVLRWRIQKQLAGLGAKPLDPTPSVFSPATAIP